MIPRRRPRPTTQPPAAPTGGTAVNSVCARIAARPIIAAAMLIIAATGCSVGPKMSLSPAPPDTVGDVMWWQIGTGQPPHRALVGIERRVTPDTIDQFIFCKRGVRLFRYRNAGLTHVGPPLPPPGGPTDWPVSRWVLRRLSASDPALPELPTPEINRVNRMDKLIDLLKTNWSGLEIRPPENMTRAQIASAVEDFPHGLTELLAASDAF